MKSREREGKEEKEREIEGRTRGRAVFLHAHPEIYLRCAVRAGKQALRSSTLYFRRDLHTERTCLRFNIRTTLSLSLSLSEKRIFACLFFICLAITSRCSFENFYEIFPLVLVDNYSPGL